jgi:hypothetical protein
MMDVFSSTPKQAMKMSSFYGASQQDQARGGHQHQQQQQRPLPNPHTKAQLNLYPAYTSPSNAHVDTTLITSSTATPSSTTIHTIASPTLPNQPLAIPSLRKIVKSAISPTYVSGAIMCFALLNTAIPLVGVQDSTRLLHAEWEIFVYLWGIVTTMQLIAHSVYMCTSLLSSIALLHYGVVIMAGVMPTPYVFRSILWLAPAFCAVTIAYQSMLFYLIFSHAKRKWAYIIMVSLFAMVPMTKLLQTDVVETETAGVLCVYSAFSICTLYIFAAVNSYSANIVDVTIAPSPTWIPE